MIVLDHEMHTSKTWNLIIFIYINALIKIQTSLNAPTAWKVLSQAKTYPP